MLSRASVAGHPIHPMLIPFPIGLWVFSLVADVIYRMTGVLVWYDVAFYTMGGGIVGAVLAAIPGLVDYLSLPLGRQARTVATTHMLLNVTILGLFVVNFLMRYYAVGTSVPFVLSIVGVGLMLFSGWFGWELIYRHGVAVATPEEMRIRLREREKPRAAS